MAVRLHVGQAPLLPGKTRQQQMQAIATQLFRHGLQRPNNTQTWAALHQHSDDVITVSVLDSPAAQAAAAEAVAAGRLEVGDFSVPVSWAPAMPPAGSIVVIVQNMPLQYARKGYMTALLRAAGQEGIVVCEFLGGSTWMGYAALSCPAADSLVAWVVPPPHDRLLTKLPSSFTVPGGPTVQIQVAGRPSLAPHLWLQLNQQLSRQFQAAMHAVDAAIAADEEVPASSSAAPLPQPQQPEGPQQPFHQSAQHHEQQQQPQKPGGQQQLQREERQQQSQQQQQQAPVGLRGSADSVMTPAAPLSPLQEQQQQLQQQQQLLHQAQQLLQQQQQGDVEMEDEQPLGGVRHPADCLPADPFAAGEAHAAWQQRLVEEMWEDAERVADEAERQLTHADRQQLQQAFLSCFNSMLQSGTCPPEHEVRSWLREQLGIRDRGYGSDSDSDGEGQAAAAHDSADVQPKGRKQPRDQQVQPRPKQRSSGQAAAPRRRSSRSNLGKQSPGFAAIFGSGQAAAKGSKAAGEQRGGGKGRDQALLSSITTQQPDTPAAIAPAPPQRRRGRAGGTER